MEKKSLRPVLKTAQKAAEEPEPGEGPGDGSDTRCGSALRPGCLRLAARSNVLPWNTAPPLRPAWSPAPAWAPDRHAGRGHQESSHEGQRGDVPPPPCPPHWHKTAMFYPQTLRTGTPSGRSSWEGLAGAEKGRPTSPALMTSVVLGTQRWSGWLALPEATWTPT